MFNDRELKRLQQLTGKANVFADFATIKDHLDILLEISDDAYDLNPCPLCGSTEHSYFNEGPVLSDGRVMCKVCGAATKRYELKSKAYDLRYNHYRSMRAAHEAWNEGKVYWFDGESGEWLKVTPETKDDIRFLMSKQNERFRELSPEEMEEFTELWDKYFGDESDIKEDCES